MSATTMLLLLTGCCLADEAPPPVLWGYVHRPAYSVDAEPRFPLQAYRPQAGDIMLLSDVNVLWSIGYAKALTGKPGHCALVVPLPNGRLGVLEAGFGASTYTRVVTLEEKFRTYKGTVWIRQRRTPLTARQSACLTHFAMEVNGGDYALLRLALQVTPLRSRGPIRTFFLGKCRGIQNRYMCSEVVLEALAYCGLIDKETTRPSATYPRDMFFDRSPNIYVNCHLDLKSCWYIPRLWTRCIPCVR